MRRVFTAYDIGQVRYVHDVLQSEGFAVMMRNVDLMHGAGELPATEVWPEVWVHNDEDAPEALERIKAIGEEMRAQADEPNWTCPGCGESIEAQFDACWKCGTEHPEVVA